MRYILKTIRNVCLEWRGPYTCARCGAGHWISAKGIGVFCRRCGLKNTREAEDGYKNIEVMFNTPVYLLIRKINLMQKVIDRLAIPREARYTEHMLALERLNEKLRAEIRSNQVALEDRNRALRATGLIVSCTGCYEGGPTTKGTLTEKDIVEVERTTVRLREWFENQKVKRKKFNRGV
jgi:ribosomal protein L40E